MLKVVKVLLSLLYAGPLVACFGRLLCYEWADDNFRVRDVVVLKKDEGYQFTGKGLQKGEFGGRHVRANVTIVPSSSSNRTEWEYPATEGQDKLVMELLDFKRNGFFIDLAARYWHKGSNSWALEYYLDWTGVCIEPDVNFYTGLVVNRTCTVVCENPVTQQKNNKVYFDYQIKSPGGAKSVGNTAGYRTTVRLADVLNQLHAPRRIDYLSLDIEGHEREALLSIDWRRFHFKVISVERPGRDVHDLLNAHGYRWLTNNGHNGDQTYISETLPSYDRAMKKYRGKAQTRWMLQDHKYLLVPQPPPGKNQSSEGPRAQQQWHHPLAAVRAQQKQQRRPSPASAVPPASPPTPPTAAVTTAAAAAVMQSPPSTSSPKARAEADAYINKQKKKTNMKT